MKLWGSFAVAAFAIVALLVAGGLLCVDDGFVRSYRAFDLRRPDTWATDLESVEPSAHGLVRWRSGVDLQVAVDSLERGDVLKVKLCSPERSQRILVSVDERQVAVLSVDADWRQHEVVIPVAARQIRLSRADAAGPGVDLSRLSVANTVGHASGAFEVAVRSPLADLGGRRINGLSLLLVLGMPPALVLSMAGFAHSLGWTASASLRTASLSLAPSAAVVVLGAAVASVSGMRVTYPGRTFALLVLLPLAGSLAVLGRRTLTTALGRAVSLLARLPWRERLGKVVRIEQWQPATASLAGVGALALLLLAAVILLPRSPYEWDEVLFLRAMGHFDIATHSPHPPGYPLYLAAAHLMNLAVRNPMRSLQLVSVFGTVVALLGVALVMRRLGATRAAAAGAGFLLVAMPAFSFHANVGMSDALATGLAMIALWACAESIARDGESAWLVGAACAAALALGTRPQVAALLAGPGAWAAFQVVRRRRWQLLATATASAVAVSAACWIPPIALTGWDRYLATIRTYRAWILEHEPGGYLPRAPLGPLFDSWFVRPFGTPPLAILFWGLVVTGSIAWWAAGRRQLTVFAGLGAAGYLGFALWRLQYDACVRYANPVLPCLAALAAGVIVVRRPWLRAVLIGAAALLGAFQAAWVAPVHLLRSREVAPVWGTLGWVRTTANPETTQVVFAGSIRPHATYLLGRDPLVAVTHDDPRAKTLPGPEVWLVGPPHWLPRGNLLHREEWTSAALRRLTRNRYQSCGVARRTHADEPALLAPLPEGPWHLQGKRPVMLEGKSPPCSLRVRPVSGTVVVARAGKELIALEVGTDAELPLARGPNAGLELVARSPDVELLTELVSAPPAPVSAATRHVPSAAWAVGAEGEQWRSDLELVNTGAQPMRCRLTFIPSDGAPLNTSIAVLPLAPGAHLPLPGVVHSLFASTSSGAITIDAEGDGLRVQSIMHRVFPDGARHSVEIPLASKGDLIDSEHPGAVAIPQAAAFGECRTSLGLVNLGASRARVVVEISDGTAGLPTTLTVSIAPRSYRLFSLKQASRGSRVSVKLDRIEGLLLAHVSVIDESSGNWLFLPMRPQRSASP